MGKKSQLVIDDCYILSKRRGNGRVIRKVWVDGKGKVTRYALAYINLNVFLGDNGRVLGYDNDHGYHHKHYLGTVTPIDFNGFEALETQFEIEFEEIHHANT